jgi:hypothetical protein
LGLVWQNDGEKFVFLVPDPAFGAMKMSSLLLTEKDVDNKKDESIARIENELYSLKIALAKREQPWFRNSSVIISILALLFSFGTTGVSYLRTHQQDIHDARSELRTLIQRLNHLPIENLEYSQKYSTDPTVAGQLSGLVNSENSLIAKQASDVIDRIPNNVSATEYSAVANALIQSALNDKALKLFQLGLTVANDVNDEVNILRSYGSTLFLTGSIENGREKYRKALTVFTRYPPTNNYYIESTHFLTEMAWSGAELSIRQCNYANTHLNEAEHHLSALNPGQQTDRLRRQFENAKTMVSACVP